MWVSFEAEGLTMYSVVGHCYLGAYFEMMEGIQVRVSPHMEYWDRGLQVW